MTSDNIIQDVENLRSAAKDGKWLKILKMYEEKRELRTAKILTATGDTVLHMAVSCGKEHVVESMVDLVCGERINDDQADKKSLVDENGNEKRLVLGAQNEKGNTPLHLAASIGNFGMCKKIAGSDHFLIAKRNHAGETPLFMAALHGHKKPFLGLHYQYWQSPGVSSTDFAHCVRRENGDTILHCALEKGHIDVAIEIVHLYKDHLKDMMLINKNGLSPLHVLAANPSVFKSKDHPGQSFVGKLLHHWFFRVRKKKQATARDELELRESGTRIRVLARPLWEYVSNPIDVDRSRWALIGDIIMTLPAILALLLLIPPIAVEIWSHGMRKRKETHKWSLQIVRELLKHASDKDMSPTPHEEHNEAGYKIVDTPLMIAAKNGVIEMVVKILKSFPSTMEVVNEEGKNVVLLAAEKRQTKLYQILCENERLGKSVFSRVDNNGNTALHLAAKLGINLNMQATTMVEEFKWFEFVKKSIPSELWEKYNNDGKTAEEIFRDSYEPQMTRDREWLNQTSQACSVVSTLVASMAFSNVANDFDEKNYSSLVALSLSLTSTISFLGILAFRSQSLNFWRYVPFMLHIAILTMFGSIVALWISLMLHGKSLSTYAILGLPIAILTIISLPIFIGPTLMSLFTKVPSPNRNTTSAIRYRTPQKKESGTGSQN